MSTLAIRQKLVDIASREVGVVEVPKNSNTGKRVKEYQRASNLEGTGWPYCAAFVDWCIMQWGMDPDVLKALKKTPAQFESWRPKTAAAFGLEDWGRKKGLRVLYASNTPELKTGDIITFDSSHVGIVDTDKDGVIFTIEGNTNEAGGRDGGGVFAKRRSFGEARRFIRILN